MLFYQLGTFTIEEDPEDTLLKGIYLSDKKVVKEMERNIPRARVLLLVDETLDVNVGAIKNILHITNEYGMEYF